ncbi:MATE family efflux transporter, partial [Acinetobacter baumannii]|nr:MATE family efflux transporter [Acinetobacter baumannii]
RISGNIGVAAYGIVSNISIVVIAVFTGIAQGMQPLVSMAHGRKDLTAEFKLFKYAVCCTVLLFVIIYPVVYFFADPIALAFN